MNSDRTAFICIQCGHEIVVRAPLAATAIHQAILLRAENLGAELQCPNCGCVFTFQTHQQVQVAMRDFSLNDDSLKLGFERGDTASA